MTVPIQHFYPSHHALGGATVAADGRLGFPDVNPATIGEQGSVGVQVDVGGTPLYSTNWPFGEADDISVYAPSVMVRKGRWAAAAQMKVTDFGSFELREPTGRSVGRRDGGGERSFEVTGAYERDSGWRFGVGVGVIQDQIADVVLPGSEIDVDRTTTSFNVDLGVFKAWRVPWESVTLTPSFGVSLANVGPTYDQEVPTRVRTQSVEKSQPMMLRVGGSLRMTSADTWRGVPTFQAGVYTSLAKELQGGEITRDAQGNSDLTLYGPLRSLFSTWDAANNVPGGERVSAWKQVKKQIGVEATVASIVTLRVGHQTGTDFTTGFPRSTAVGAGVDLYYVRFDISTEVGSDAFWDNTTFGRITARIPLDGVRPSIWSQ